MILVTGATGKIGAGLRKLLADGNIKARLLTRDPAKATGLASSSVEVVKGDLGDKASVEKALQGVDHFFLNVESSAGSLEMANNAIHAAQRAGVQHIVRLSVLGADIHSPVQLSRWHAATEAVLKASGIPWTILRPGMFMQNILNSAHTIKTDGVFYGAGKDGKVPAIDARDIAAAAVKALTEPGHEGKTYNLTGPEALSSAEQAAKLSAALGRTIKYVDLPPGHFLQGLLGAGLPKWLAEDYVAMAGWIASGNAATVLPDLSKLIGKVHSYEAGHINCD